MSGIGPSGPRGRQIKADQGTLLSYPEETSYVYQVIDNSLSGLVLQPAIEALDYEIFNNVNEISSIQTEISSIQTEISSIQTEISSIWEEFPVPTYLNTEIEPLTILSNVSGTSQIPQANVLKNGIKVDSLWFWDIDVLEDSPLLTIPAGATLYDASSAILYKDPGLSAYPLYVGTEGYESLLQTQSSLSAGALFEPQIDTLVDGSGFYTFRIDILARVLTSGEPSAGAGNSPINVMLESYDIEDGTPITYFSAGSIFPSTIAVQINSVYTSTSRPSKPHYWKLYLRNDHPTDEEVVKFYVASYRWFEVELQRI